MVMAPVHLPPPNAAHISLPAQASDPPTLADLTNASRYYDKLSENKRMSTSSRRVTDNDLGQALLYVHKLCDRSRRQGDDAIPTAGTIRDIIRDSLAPLRERVDMLMEKVDTLLEISSQAYNAACGSGEYRNYKVIPFRNVDGEVEQPEEHDLPLLITSTAINDLSNDRLNEYMDRYRIQRPANLS
ncbi:hypothetical protein BKA93DRAFT_778738 [Sparassis latifolia]